MAFGLKRDELRAWQEKVRCGKIAFLTHYWMDERFPESYTVTKVGCSDLEKLQKWGEKYGLDSKWIHRDDKYPHFDLFGEYQREVLYKEKQFEQIERFNLSHD
ncbi:hypothetical protein [Oceanobacillus salinisoli]|uniref:hypothetical protein n=1 Tax=Oceanobacillus salinisoli TaxID=2678611 RepID=UPI0012E1EB5B|nr:hypothetical protein [Oceanobacillus salinisoli]